MNAQGYQSEISLEDIYSDDIRKIKHQSYKIKQIMGNFHNESGERNTIVQLTQIRAEQSGNHDMHTK